jgi:hypothetical protein
MKAKFEKVQLGMSVVDVVAVLGNGTQLAKEEVPLSPDFRRPEGDRLVPVVTGDVFRKWTDPAGNDIIIGFSNNKVVDIRYREVDS